MAERSAPRVDRVSPSDAMVLATDRGPAPMHMGAVLVLEPGHVLDLAAVRRLLDERSARVPRLRQVLVRAPLGCGRPYWVADPAFDIARHVTGRVLPRDERALLDAAADLLASPLDRSRPPWAAAWLSGWDVADRDALVVVMHHVLADGIGGLAVLAALADAALANFGAAPHPPPYAVAARRPDRRTLAVDAARGRVAALRRAPSAVRGLAAGLRELGLGSGVPALAARVSLLRPTGPRRRFTTVDVPLADVVSAAHRRGCTVNDVVIVAVVGALAGLLRRRGEHPAELVVSVPVSARRQAGAGLGNQAGVRPVAVPAQVPPQERLRAVVAATTALRDTPRAASAAPLGVAFRGLARLGLFRVFVEHQRLVHTFESNVPGPAQPLRLGGRQVTGIVPIVANPGNVGVSFVLLSYAGRLVATVVADPEIVPDQDVLTGLLREELAGLVDPAVPPSYGGSHPTQE